MNTMKWLLRREFWEHKGGFFWAPVIAGAVFILFNLMAALVGIATADRAGVELSMIRFNAEMLGPEMRQQAGAVTDLVIVGIAWMVMLITGFVVFFYSIGALYDERRDRSILFWKSLPLSDSATVISKVLSATLVAPVIGLLAGVATAILMIMLSAMFGLFYGQNFLTLIFAANPFTIVLILLASIPIGALWALPTVGWLMLCSVAARSKPFLWAVALPIAAGVMVSWFDMMRTLAMPDGWFWKQVVARLLLSVMPGSWLNVHSGNTSIVVNEPSDLAAHLTLGNMYSTLGSLDLWIGAAAGVAMLVLAIRLRRWKDDG